MLCVHSANGCSAGTCSDATTMKSREYGHVLLKNIAVQSWFVHPFFPSQVLATPIYPLFWTYM